MGRGRWYLKVTSRFSVLVRGKTRIISVAWYKVAVGVDSQGCGINLKIYFVLQFCSFYIPDHHRGMRQYDHNLTSIRREPKGSGALTRLHVALDGFEQIAATAALGIDVVIVIRYRRD